MVLSIREEIERLEDPGAEAKSTGNAVRPFAFRLQAVTPWATYCLLAVLVIIFALEEVWGDSTSVDLLIRMGALFSGESLIHEPWRLFSHAFLHIGALHLVFNGLALLSMGVILERLLGSRRFLVVYGFSALGGGVAIALVGSGSVTAGASGALWGLMVAEALVLSRGHLAELTVEQIKTIWRPVALNIANSFRPGVSLAGHLGGGLVGASLVLSGLITVGLAGRSDVADVVSPPGSPDLGNRAASDNASSWLAIGTFLIPILMATSLVMALMAGRPWGLRQPPELARLALAGTSLSLEMPVELTAHPVEDKDGTLTFAFGQPDRNPMVFFLSVTPRQKMAPGDVPTALNEAREQLQKELKTDQPVRWVIEMPPQIVPLGGNQAVFGGLRSLEGARLSTYLLFLDQRGVRMSIVSSPALPEGWKGIRDRVAGSLRLENEGTTPAGPR